MRERLYGSLVVLRPEVASCLILRASGVDVPLANWGIRWLETPSLGLLTTFSLFVAHQLHSVLFDLAMFWRRVILLCICLILKTFGKLHLEALTKAWVGVWVISLPMAVAGAYSVAIALGCTCMRVSSIA